MSSSTGKAVVIADYDFGDVAIERAIIEGAGLTLTAAHCKTEDEVIDVARDADAIVAQYATVGAKAIGAFTRCEVIARYGMRLRPGLPRRDLAVADRVSHPPAARQRARAAVLVIQAPLTKRRTTCSARRNCAG